MDMIALPAIEGSTPWPFPPDDILVGCRVNGAIQHFHIATRDHRQAQETVRQGVEGASAILALIVNPSKGI